MPEIKRSCTIFCNRVDLKVMPNIHTNSRSEFNPLGLWSRYILVCEVILHNNVGHYNVTYSKNHGKSIQEQCFFLANSCISVCVTKRNDTNTGGSCNLPLTFTCGRIWCETNQNKFYHIYVKGCIEDTLCIQILLSWPSCINIQVSPFI